ELTGINQKYSRLQARYNKLEHSVNRMSTKLQSVHKAYNKLREAYNKLQQKCYNKPNDGGHTKQPKPRTYPVPQRNR
ncbi:MAG: hypothetical protein OXB84_01175, partial [Halobacteriovoraceae bacterium]|nr:hypothetical protein [Halobacteriovoraceae bacterium]